MSARPRSGAFPGGVQARVWVKADRLQPLIPRETPRFTALYRRRVAVERELVGSRTSARSLRADLTILACALSRERAVAVMVA